MNKFIINMLFLLIIISIIFIIREINNINKKLECLRYIQSYSMCENIIKKEK